MKCPVCKSELIITGQERLQTLDEHVSDPNGEPCLKDKYECSNEKCETRGLYMWNEYGEWYNHSDLDYENEELSKKRRRLEKEYSNLAPYGTLERQMNVEISKNGLKRETKLSPLLMLGFLQPVIEHCYRSNYDGEILGKYYKLEWRRRDKSFPNSGYCIGYHFPWTTWKYLWDNFQRRRKNGDIQKAYEKSYNRDWRYRAFEWVIEKLYGEKFVDRF